MLVDLELARLPGLGQGLMVDPPPIDDPLPACVGDVVNNPVGIDVA